MTVTKRIKSISPITTLVCCRACEGDGIVQADKSDNHGRVTRDSKTCPYCNGKGWIKTQGKVR